MVFGPRRQHRHPHAGGGARAREARAAGGRRPASDHLGGARRAQGRHLSAADLHPVRDARARARPPTARCSGASRSSSRSSSRRTTTRSCICWPRSSASPTRCSRTSRSRTTCRSAEDILREINRGGWSTGYSGQSPERLKLHMANQKDFDLVTLRAPRTARARATITACRGRAGARRSSSIPARHMLYNTNLHVMDGGGTFRARFGVEREVKLPDGTRARTTCWPRAPTRSAPRSRTAIPSSPTAC